MNAFTADHHHGPDLDPISSHANGHFVVGCPSCGEKAVTVPMCMSAMDVVRRWACKTRHVFGALLASHQKSRRNVEAGGDLPLRLAS